MIRIEVYLEAGLGNRIRVINSILNWLESRGITSYSIKLYWRKGRDLNASFEDILERIEGVHVINVSRTSVAFLMYKLRYFCLFLAFRRGFHAFRNIRDSILLEGIPDQAGKIYISTVHQFHPIKRNFVHFSDKVIEKTKIPCCKYIGIHIRQGDNRESVTNSPAFLFQRKVQEILSQNPSSRFYLSTDSVDERQKFQSLFKEALIVSEAAKINRDTPEGIQDAARDMLILSKAERIIGSYYSSFSEVASQFHHIPLEILKKSS